MNLFDFEQAKQDVKGYSALQIQLRFLHLRMLSNK